MPKFHTKSFLDFKKAESNNTLKNKSSSQQTQTKYAQTKKDKISNSYHYCTSNVKTLLQKRRRSNILFPAKTL